MGGDVDVDPGTSGWLEIGSNEIATAEFNPPWCQTCGGPVVAIEHTRVVRTTLRPIGPGTAACGSVSTVPGGNPAAVVLEHAREGDTWRRDPAE